MSPWLFSLFLLYTPLILAASQCGTFHIPFPFYLNSTPPLHDAFHLSCINSSSLFLTIASRSYRILRFFPDGLLLDFPNTTLCRHYNDLRSFSFAADQHFAISSDNILDLYDCEDSSLCKPVCERTSLMPSCDGRPAGYPSCCYPLSDRTSWRPGDSITAFSKYGCRGFSSWVVIPGSSTGLRGVKLEWAVPRNSTHAACAPNANVVNATSVANGFRCQCADGFSGDGFPSGVGCLKSCFKDGKEVDGSECYQVKHGRKKAIILAGVLTSTLSVVSLTALFLMKRRIRSDKLITEQPHFQANISSHKARLFTYHELEEATRGFGDSQKIVDSSSPSTLYHGVVGGGSRVAVQKVDYCDTESDLIQIMLRLERLSAVSHRNMARVIGWSINAGSTPLVVYDYPQNGTLMDHLRRARYENVPFHWHKRLSVAAQTASTLAFLHNEISPPLFHHDLHSACIFLDIDFSVKLAGFDLLNDEGSGRRRNDVYSLGLVLLEIITGDAVVDCTTAALHKGKIEEMVDPSLYYHEQPSSRREQIQIVVDLATRCLLFGADAKLGMVDVARELLHIAKDCVDGGSRRGPALEETFSNSSLLQMISMSPDSIHVPSQSQARPDHMYN
ncbi:probably inactive receptor-like protein kinase At2g46850 [Salvia hispanica]|uniref:probably inactive receptor-like protein kinase At2g46850 n=1 Tax=Salvia hispanica TaxID=49212 RepID=UPI002009A1BF|nr:probably inactive receptor-like protein kinase At2g46850 [Salvia hispanica]XP_047959956.1 probably inactive receptor-like protein kinase At2g46850 [Salvia hispanica]